MAKAKSRSGKLIVVKDYVSNDMEEKWAYELAKLS